MTTQTEDEAISRLEARLFRSMARDEPSPRARDVTAAALGIAAATAAKSAGAGTVVTAVTSLLGATSTQAIPVIILKSIAVGAMAGAVAMGGAAYVKRTLGPAAAPANSTTPIAAVSSAARSVSDLSSIQPAMPLHASSASSSDPSLHAPEASAAVKKLEPEQSRLEPSPLVPAVAPEALAPPGAAAVPALRAEVALLDHARSALTRAEAAAAREWLDQYHDQFPNGSLALEAHVLWIESLFLSGDSARASALAREFLNSHANSTHSGRMRYLLSKYENP